MTGWTALPSTLRRTSSRSASPVTSAPTMTSPLGAVAPLSGWGFLIVGLAAWRIRTPRKPTIAMAKRPRMALRGVADCSNRDLRAFCPLAPYDSTATRLRPPGANSGGHRVTYPDDLDSGGAKIGRAHV